MIDIPSDDISDQQPDLPSTGRTTRTTRTSRRTTSKELQNTRSRVKAASTSSSVASSSSTVASAPLILVPPKKKISPKKTRKPSGKYKSLHTFWGIPQGNVFPIATTTAPSDNQSSASINEDADDLIEDLSDDNVPLPLPPPPRELTKNGNLGSQFVGSQSSVVVSRNELNRPIDSQPWAERFAPQGVADLALNKLKVKEVRSWLENVLDGTLRQRLLVLKGPAGTGKTATLNTLARELDVEVLEWRNPQGAAAEDEYGEEGAFATGLSGLFEEFVARAGTFGGLQLTAPSEASPVNSRAGKKKIVVVEDFPNTLFTPSSAPLKSFRHSIKSFLALPAPFPSTRLLPPLILIVTETTSISGPDSFTAHRLLSPEILGHRFTREISFNKIAPTYMFKALTAIIQKEARQSGRKFGPSKPMLEALSTSGDIRSAVTGLEFLALNGDQPGKGFSERIELDKRKRGTKRPISRGLTSEEKNLALAVTQRESTLGIFHAVGKVVYNKRYGEPNDPIDLNIPPPPRPPLKTHPYHSHAIRIDLNSLVDDTGTDPPTFIASLHENYIGSCNPGGQSRLASTADEDILDTVNSCLDYLSDSDIFSSKGFSGAGDSAGIRSNEISFQTAVRGIMLSLPFPVRRFQEPKGGATKMYYPTSARLWRGRQEVEDSVEWYVDRERGKGCCVVAGKNEALLERIPYIALVERRREWGQKINSGSMFGNSQLLQKAPPGKVGPIRERLDPAVKKALDEITAFTGVGKQSEEPDDDHNEVDEDIVHKKRNGINSDTDTFDDDIVGEEVEKLVLSDDDIEDF